MRYAQKYAPKCFDDVWGHHGIIQRLKMFALEPHPACFLFCGPGGVGKSATAVALMNELGISDWSVHKTSGAQLKVDEVRRLFTETFRLCPFGGDRFNVWQIDEWEYVNKEVKSELKTFLSEENHPSRLIVIATSNNPSSIDAALLQRFERLQFKGDNNLAEWGTIHLGRIWHDETGNGDILPPTIVLSGWDNGSWSMRLAMQELEAEVSARRAREEVAA